MHCPVKGPDEPYDRNLNSKSMGFHLTEGPNWDNSQRQVMTQAYLEVLCKQRFLSIITNLWLFQEICLNGITNFIFSPSPAKCESKNLCNISKSPTWVSEQGLVSRHISTYIMLHVDSGLVVVLNSRRACHLWGQLRMKPQEGKKKSNLEYSNSSCST